MCRQVVVPQLDGNDTDCAIYMLASMKKMVLWGAELLAEKLEADTMAESLPMDADMALAARQTMHEEIEQGRLSEVLPQTGDGLILPLDFEPAHAQNADLDTLSFSCISLYLIQSNIITTAISFTCTSTCI